MANFRSLLLAFTLIAASTIAKAQSGNNSLLWRITGKGLKKASYIFGAIDYICPGDFMWTKGMEDSLAKSNKVCFALNLGDSALKRQAFKMVMSNGKKMEAYFSPTDYVKVKTYASDTLHLDMANIQNLRPIAIQPLIIKRLIGCADAVSYDMTILAIAKKEGKEILGLETVDEEVDEIDRTNFNDKVTKTLTEMAGGSTYYYEFRRKLMNAYKQQDLETEYAVYHSNTLLSPEDLKVFLDKKSHRWATRMPAMMAQSSVFFVLSSSNLWGSEGLINLLRNAGYKVEPVH